MKPRAVVARLEHLELVEALHVECERALPPVDLPLEGVATTEREPRRLERPDRAVLELDGRLDGVVDLTPGRKVRGRLRPRRSRRRGSARGRHVGREVAERARAGRVPIEAPHLRCRVAPVLQVAPAEVPDLAELTRVDQLPGESDCGNEAVVERTQVLHAGRLHAAPISKLSAASRPSGFSQTTCFPASAAASWARRGARSDRGCRRARSRDRRSGPPTASSSAQIRSASPPRPPPRRSGPRSRLAAAAAGAATSCTRSS